MSAEVVPITKAHGVATHAYAYDAPNLSPKEFYRAVMHSSHLSLTIRMDAAVKLMRIEAAEPASVILHDEARPLYKIIIGGLPDNHMNHSR